MTGSQKTYRDRIADTRFLGALLLVVGALAIWTDAGSHPAGVSIWIFALGAALAGAAWVAFHPLTLPDPPPRKPSAWVVVPGCVAFASVAGSVLSDTWFPTVAGSLGIAAGTYILGSALRMKADTSMA